VDSHLWGVGVIQGIDAVAAVAMRIDNDGEGGILALMSLLGVKHKVRSAIIGAG
jgi:KUP system potassium uptake protein